MFIGRKQDGRVYGCWSVRQPNDADHPGIEEVADNHPDVIAYFAPRPGEDFKFEGRWIALTQEELDAKKELELNNTFSVTRIQRMIFEIEFDQENRLRVLEGKLPISAAVYRDALITRYKAL
jgi:hypothetical protein